MKKNKILFITLLAVSLVACNNNSNSSSINLNSSSINSNSSLSSTLSSTSLSSSSSTSSSKENSALEEFKTILKNTFALKEVGVNEWYIPAAEHNNFYVEEGLMYEKTDGNAEIYTYIDGEKTYSVYRDGLNENWQKREETIHPSFDLGYYFNNKYNFEVKNDFQEENFEAFDDYIGGNGVTFYNNDGVKIGCIYNETRDLLAGIKIYEESGNFIYQYTITTGKQEHELPIISGELTKEDYLEVFSSVLVKMEEVSNKNQKRRLKSFDLEIREEDLIENTNPIGVLNARVFNYFFIQVLSNDDFVLTDEFINYAAEETGVSTGLIQFKYEQDHLYGSMYMQPKGVIAPGLFTISINYDFETSEIKEFEWMLRAVGGAGSMYYYYDGTNGYTVVEDSDSMASVISYLDNCLQDYTTPSEGSSAANFVAEWTEATRYANEGIKE